MCTWVACFSLLNLARFAHHCTRAAVCSRSASQWFLCVCVFFLSAPESAGARWWMEEGDGAGAGHWLSSRAQTCCGHPVRPFAFFSAVKLSCRPSLCGGTEQQSKVRQEAEPSAPYDDTSRHISAFAVTSPKRQGIPIIWAINTRRLGYRGKKNNIIN